MVVGIFLLGVLSALLVHEHYIAPHVDLGPPSGQLYSVGFFGDRMHISCMGPNDAAKNIGQSPPLVIFHTGIGMSSGVFADLQGSLASRGVSSCTYDRLGLGHSPARSLPTTSTIGPTPLRWLLTALDLARVDQLNLPDDVPEIHVGHSLGSVEARIVAGLAPERVCGLVLVDPTVESDIFAPKASFLGNIYGAMTFLGIPRAAAAMGVSLSPYAEADLPRKTTGRLDQPASLSYSYAAALLTEAAQYHSSEYRSAADTKPGDAYSASCLLLSAPVPDMDIDIPLMEFPTAREIRTAIDASQKAMSKGEMAYLPRGCPLRIVENTNHLSILNAHDALLSAIQTTIDQISS